MAPNDNGVANNPESRQSQQSNLAKSLLTQRMPMSITTSPSYTETGSISIAEHGSGSTSPPQALLLSPPVISELVRAHGIPRALNDTPLPSHPSSVTNSPRLLPIRQNSGDLTPRVRSHPSTLNIPGMTTSKASPDGKIAKRDVNAKLVVIMVGLPARGKSYITKKIHRYLSWQQHNTHIFNVGNRRRNVAGSVPATQSPRAQLARVTSSHMDGPTQAAHILLTGVDPYAPEEISVEEPSEITSMDQNADFFSPQNTEAAAIREAVALSTLDEVLAYLLDGDGSVGILDATNSTIARRQKLFDHIKEREPKLGILFVESICEDERLLEANMRLKLRGPDYRGKDPEKSYEDFKLRVAAYESAYVPLGDYEEKNNMQYIKMIDVGRKVIHHQLAGFLAGGIASYLSTFNLSPRQIWITRHGKSVDNQVGKLGGNSNLTDEGAAYAGDLYDFVTQKRNEWENDQRSRVIASDGMPVPQRPGDNTPPYPDIIGDLDEKNFCVWTSMLNRSAQTAAYFSEDDNYDVKHWTMLNELNTGAFEGLTYKEIEERHPEEYQKRSNDKLQYIYPGVGGEGYLQVISRLRDMVREIERIKDHVLIIGHRSVARVLMAYFMDLTRDDIADLDVPLGMLFVIEPKPYGIDFHAYKHNPQQRTFEELLGYKTQKEVEKGN
ncbi:putative 6-phosphofructo-2-kinase PB17E12.14c [Calycina marina]|uniref:6-phosphofructo-2-kinase PB17E12.14c n=1 Tax=Calycina marina TaxID=1763456 RepID=A0A9P7Z687_9HELO|nr:putative 6-phosphofructo-2-kinase PB17E12.14c [Calycina marina]